MVSLVKLVGGDARDTAALPGALTESGPQFVVHKPVGRHGDIEFVHDRIHAFWFGPIGRRTGRRIDGHIVGAVESQPVLTVSLFRSATQPEGPGVDVITNVAFGPSARFGEGTGSQAFRVVAGLTS